MHYHDYQVVGEDERAVVEVCKECKNKLVTKKNIKDRGEYLKEHVRDSCQPAGATAKIFKQFYGEAKK